MKVGRMRGAWCAAVLLTITSANALRAGPIIMNANAAVSSAEYPARPRLVDIDLGGGKSVSVANAWPVWPATQALARVLAHAPSIVKGKRVLELGCGLGAVGLAAASSQAREVVLTDADEAVLECAAEAAVTTGLDRNVRTRVFDWADSSQVEELVENDEPYDLILAADVLYGEPAPDLVASVLNVLLQKQPTAQALIADPVNRTLRTAFAIACAARGLRLAEGPMPGMEGMRLLSVSKQGYMA